jgi:hypothetical protein
MQFRIVTFGAKQAAATLTNIGERAVNARPAFEQIYLTVLDIVDEIFDKEGERGGQEPWLPLTPGHLRWKQKHHKDLRILRMDGDLHASVTKFKHPQQFSRIAKDHIVFKSTVPFSDVHFHGQKKKGVGSRTPGTEAFHRGVPKRQFIFFTEADRRAFAKEILVHLMKTKQLKGPA